MVFLRFLCCEASQPRGEERCRYGDLLNKWNKWIVGKEMSDKEMM